MSITWSARRVSSDPATGRWTVVYVANLSRTRTWESWRSHLRVED